jgi:hypothetical protein
LDKVRIFVCGLILFIFAFSFVYAIGNDYGIDPSVTVERFTLEDGLVEVTVIHFIEYDEATVRVAISKKSRYSEDAGFAEKTFLETIEKWIREEDHRYYKYSVRKRDNWDNRKTTTGALSRHYEFCAVLYK